MRRQEASLLRAKELRSHQTPAEKIVWQKLRRKKLGCRFRRQASIGPYIVDFLCSEKRIVIEIDGGVHAEQKARDQRRDAYIQTQGFRIIRIWNHQIYQMLDDTMEYVYSVLHEPPPVSSPLEKGEERLKR